jgi:hypothetical protein
MLLNLVVGELAVSVDAENQKLLISIKPPPAVFAFFKELMSELSKGVDPASVATAQIFTGDTPPTQPSNEVGKAMDASENVNDPIKDMTMASLQGAPKTTPDFGQIDHLGNKSPELQAAASIASGIVDGVPQVLKPTTHVQPAAANGVTVINNTGIPPQTNATTSGTPVNVSDKQSVPDALKMSQNETTAFSQFAVANNAAITAGSGPVVRGFNCSVRASIANLPADVQATLNSNLETAGKRSVESVTKMLKKAFPADDYQAIDSLTEAQRRTLLENVLISQAAG